MARASGMVPCVRSSSAQPATAPGTVTAYGPCEGISRWPSAASRSASAREPARPVEFSALSVSGAGIIDEREDVSANAGHRRLDDGKDGRGGHGRIDGVAAFLEHLEACRRGKRVAAGNDARGYPNTGDPRPVDVADRAVTGACV